MKLRKPEDVKLEAATVAGGEAKKGVGGAGGKGDGFGATGAGAADGGGFGGADDIGGVGEGTPSALAAAATDGALGTSFGGGLGPAAGNLMRNNLMGGGTNSAASVGRCRLTR